MKTLEEKRYDRLCSYLFRKANKLGVELKFNPKNFDPKRLNCLWYGGELATIKAASNVKIELSIRGDVYAVLKGKKGNAISWVKDKNSAGAFTDQMAAHIRDDTHLHSLTDSGRLWLDYGNWIEYDGIVLKNESDKTGTFVDLGIIVDNILDDNILKAIDEALDRCTEIVNEIEEEWRSMIMNNLGNIMKNPIEEFRGQYFYLSNFYDIEIQYKGLTFRNSEAAFQAMKCPQRAHEFSSLCARSARLLGRMVPLRSDWSKVKEQIMYEVCSAKFQQHPELRDKLLETGARQLIEGNFWNDTEWVLV